MTNKNKQNKNTSSSKKVNLQKEIAKVPVDKKSIWLILTLVIICFSFYANTCYNDYCLDDTMVITENSSTQKGFAGIKEHLTQDLLFGYKHVKSKSAASAGWRPLSLITYSVEIGFWGKNKPGYSHFVNVLIYAAIVVLIFLFLYWYLLKEIWISFFSALLFAIHPIHTEVVANIKGRDELLCLLFLLLSLHQLWKFIHLKNNRYLIVSLVCYFLSLTSKETSFTFVAGISVMIYFFTGLKRSQIISTALGFASAAVLYLLIRNAVVPLTDFAPNPEIINNSFLKAVGLESVCTKLYVLLLDLKMLLFPHPLSYDYSYNQIPYKNTSDLSVWVSLILYISLLLIALKGIKKKNIFSFCIIMFLITLSISSNLFIEIGMMFGERLLFIPSIFFCISLAVIGKNAADLLDQKIQLKKIITTAVLILPVLFASGYKTISRNSEWENERTLMLADISKCPNSARANSGAGGAVLFFSFENGIDKNRKDSLLKTALNYLKKSIQIYPEYNDALLNIGVAYSQMDSSEKAEEYWNMVRVRSPNHPKLIYFDNFLANKYLNAGMEYSRNNHLDSALMFFNKALNYSTRSDSIKVSCLYNLGGLYYTAGNYENARDAFGKVIEINPDYLNAKVGYTESEKMIGKK